MQNYITKIFKKSTENQAKTDYTHYTVPTTTLAVIFFRHYYWFVHCYCTHVFILCTVLHVLHFDFSRFYALHLTFWLNTILMHFASLLLYILHLKYFQFLLLS